MDLMTRCAWSRYPLLAIWLVVFAVAPVVTAIPARAQTTALSESEVFTVRDVSVDVTAETAASARRQALRDGQVEALDRMLQRLTRRADHAALPQVDAETAAFMVQGLEIADEKTSPVRYLAELTVRFKPDEVRKFLRQTGLPFAETASRPLLVIPVLKSPSGLMLWEVLNRWRSAWGSLPIRRGLVPMIVPLGDLTDIADIDASQAMLGDPDALTAIVDRYRAGSALVALATLSVRDDGLLVLDVAASRPSDPDTPPILLSFTAASADGVDSLMTIAASETAAAIEDEWLSRHLLRFDQTANITVLVPVANLEQWIDIQRKLRSLATISRVDLRVLRRDSAEVDITYFGDEAQLTAALARNDLELETALPMVMVPDSRAAVAPGTAAPSGDRMRVLRPRDF